MKRLLAVLFVLLFALATILMMVSKPLLDPEAARAAERLKVSRELKAENETRLTTYATSDRGGFQIPIERAMELTIPELNARPPAPAVPQETPPP